MTTVNHKQAAEWQWVTFFAIGLLKLTIQCFFFIGKWFSLPFAHFCTTSNIQNGHHRRLEVSGGRPPCPSSAWTARAFQQSSSTSRWCSGPRNLASNSLLDRRPSSPDEVINRAHACAEFTCWILWRNFVVPRNCRAVSLGIWYPIEISTVLAVQVRSLVN